MYLWWFCCIAVASLMMEAKFILGVVATVICIPPKYHSLFEQILGGKSISALLQMYFSRDFTGKKTKTIFNACLVHQLGEETSATNA
jgi:hypothetical protein